jgi:hypothetical protein
MSLDTLQLTFKVSVSGQGAKNPVGQDYQPIEEPIAISKQVGPFLQSNANNAALGANELISQIFTIAASGNLSLDLTNLTDILFQASISLARVKGILIRLLSATDDATNGNGCSGVTIGNATSNGFPMFLANTTSEMVLGNGEFVCWATPGASGLAVSGTSKNLYLVNNDASNAAKVQITLLGGTS